jgi:hypothetical protein
MTFIEGLIWGVIVGVIYTIVSPINYYKCLKKKKELNVFFSTEYCRKVDWYTKKKDESTVLLISAMSNDKDKRFLLNMIDTDVRNLLEYRLRIQKLIQEFLKITFLPCLPKYFFDFIFDQIENYFGLMQKIDERLDFNLKVLSDFAEKHQNKK